MRIRSFRDALLYILSPQALIPFLFASLCLAVLGNVAYGLATNWLGTSNSALAQIGLGTLALFLLMGALFFRSVRRFRLEPVVSRDDCPAQRKGLILLVSNNGPSCEKAISHHRNKLKVCWLLFSDRPDSTATAGALRKHIERLGRKAIPVSVDNVYDPLEFMRKVDAIYRGLDEPDLVGFNLTEKDVILDFTGMTSCASVGSVLASLGRDRPLQYTPPFFGENLNSGPKVPLDPREIILTWETPSEAARQSTQEGAAGDTADTSAAGILGQV